MLSMLANKPWRWFADDFVSLITVNLSSSMLFIMHRLHVPVKPLKYLSHLLHSTNLPKGSSSVQSVHHSVNPLKALP